MVEIQKAQEWAELIRPWDEIRNVGYTSRRIDQKMQVRNTYLDWDNAGSIDQLAEPQWSWELQAINHFTHKVVWKNAFDELWESWIYIPSDWTYIVKCMIWLWPIDENDVVMLVVQKNAVIWESWEVILQKYIIADHWSPHETFEDWAIVNLNKWDVLYVWAWAWCQYSAYPIDSHTHINLVKLS